MRLGQKESNFVSSASICKLLN